MSLLRKYAEGWLQTLEEIQSEAQTGSEKCQRCGHDPASLSQLEKNILADLRRVFEGGANT